MVTSLFQVLGLPGIIHSICCNPALNRTEPLQIYGPPGLRHLLHSTLDVLRPNFELPLFVTELVPPNTTALVGYAQIILLEMT